VCCLLPSARRPRVLPSVANVARAQMHGMGDAATNTGMVSMRKAISERLGGAYVVNVAMGASAVADARNSIFLSMDLEVEAFAMQVRKDYRLAHGFNAIGYSQVRATVHDAIVASAPHVARSRWRWCDAGQPSDSWLCAAVQRPARALVCEHARAAGGS
jgi:hypothetical protein